MKKSVFKRFWAAAMALMICLSASGCSGKSEETPEIMETSQTIASEKTDSEEKSSEESETDNFFGDDYDPFADDYDPYGEGGASTVTAQSAETVVPEEDETEEEIT
ncbi:MAG: hypothetical protein J6K92_06240, partial [Oscillospiraceae bacterium]|nr:hypothetical protein [Oscillospiraceae bacterium]